MPEKIQLHHNSGYQDPNLPSWERVVLKKQQPETYVKPDILNSWIRSQERGIDPYLKMGDLEVLSPKDLTRYKKENEDLIRIANPIMDMVSISVRGTGFLVILSEKKGYVLRIKGEEDILKLSKSNHLVPGCRRTEELIGTDGIGLCMIEKKPLQITGSEHYNVNHHPWTCSCAPIHGPDQQLLGVLSLAGRSIGQHLHTFALVSSAAELIESQLREKELFTDKQKLNSLLTLAFNSMTDGVLVINDDLTISNSNATAARLLDQTRNNILEKRLDEFIDVDPEIIKAIKEKTHISHREIISRSQNQPKALIGNVTPIYDEDFNSHGSLITFTKKDKVMEMVRKIDGNYAKYNFDNIKGNNLELLKQIRLAKIAANNNTRVIITGESGTGKELFAQAIHNYSPRRNGPFVAISCTAIPRDLIESELFGYLDGAFTGARKKGQVGKFELANDGTIFLDEINGMPLELQGKLLRALQENLICRLGDTNPTPLDILVIAASNTDLLNEVHNNNFREDLYYRLNVVEINIPPLRDRSEDLEILVNHMLERHCLQKGIATPNIPDEVMDILAGYSWPGNIRELENCIERAILLAEGGIIKKEHLPERIAFADKPNLGRTTAHWENPKELIEHTLKQTGGNISKAANRLGIARSTLYRKMEEYGVAKKVGMK